MMTAQQAAANAHRFNNQLDPKLPKLLRDIEEASLSGAFCHYTDSMPFHVFKALCDLGYKVSYNQYTKTWTITWYTDEQQT